MALLWASETSMTATEIVDASEDRTWQEASIFSLIQTPLRKGAIAYDRHKLTATKKQNHIKQHLLQFSQGLFHI